MRKPHLAAMDPKPGEVMARCSFCRALVYGPPTIHGDRHEECGVGRLETIAMLTDAMLREHETSVGRRVVHEYGEALERLS